MQPSAPPAPCRLPALLAAIIAAGAVAMAVCLRALWLENMPGLNGDEAWYGVQALETLRRGAFPWHTPTGNPINPLFLGPLALLHTVFPPSVTVLRSVAVVSGLVALPINWWFCCWVYGRRTAAISTVALAVLPINIAYSRLAWDASQSLAATLPVMYLSLAAARWAQWRGRLLAAAIGAQLVAALVHPTNLFAAAPIAVVLADGMRWRNLQAALSEGRVRGRVLLYAGLALLGAAVLVAWFFSGGATRFTARVSGPREWMARGATGELLISYARLLTGGTAYRYLAGSQSWLAWPAVEEGNRLGADVAVFWLAMASSASMLWRSWRHHDRLEDRVLLLAWALEVLGFALVAGPHALQPGWERFAICLVGPTVIVASRGLALWAGDSPGRRWTALTAVSLAGWIMLADCGYNCFGFIAKTGGRAHETFRTASIEPKAAALNIVVQHRREGPTWIIASRWWNYWPLRYLASSTGIHVLSNSEAGAWHDLPTATQQGRVWHVEFAGSPNAQEVRRKLTGRELKEWLVKDSSGSDLLCVLHATEEVSQRGESADPNMVSQPLAQAPLTTDPRGRTRRTSP